MEYKFKMGEIELPLLFGLPALEKIVEATQITEFTKSLSLNIFKARDMLYYAHLNHCEAERIPQMATAREIYNFIEKNFYSPELLAELKNMTDVFNKATYTGPSNGKVDEQKKTSIGGK